MASPFILVALIFALLPFVLPIVSLVRTSRLRQRLAALEDALDDQKHTIHELERRLTQLKGDAVTAAPPIAPPPVPSEQARPPQPAAPRVSPRDAAPTPTPDMWRDLTSGLSAMLKT